MLSLQEPIALYFTLASDASVVDLARVFAEDATVRDEEKEHRGLDAIRRWRVDTMERTPFEARPLSLEERDGAAIVPAEVTGAFPGSPVVLDHRFTLRDDRILTLEIG